MGLIHYRVEEDEDQAAVSRPGPDDVHDGERDGQHQVRAHHRVRRHEEPAGVFDRSPATRVRWLATPQRAIEQAAAKGLL